MPSSAYDETMFAAPVSANFSASFRVSLIVENLLTIGRLDNDTNQVQHGGTRFARVATRSGKVAHLMHPTKGVLCPDMRDWPADQWQAAPPSLPLHGRCAVAAGISQSEVVS